jgi:hypothetical protein
LERSTQKTRSERPQQDFSQRVFREWINFGSSFPTQAGKGDHVCSRRRLHGARGIQDLGGGWWALVSLASIGLLAAHAVTL